MFGNVFFIQRFSLFDGPGVRTVVFLKGCPLRCIWCHNPEGVEAASQIMYNASKCIGCGECVSTCIRGAHRLSDGLHIFDRSFCTGCGECAKVCCTQALSTAGNIMSTDEVMLEIMKDKQFYLESGGGVTLSGGEPLMQADFAISILKMSKENEISTCVETCGMVDSSKLLEAARYTDVFYFDYKATGEKMHRELCSCAQYPILGNLERLDKIHANVTLRCPIIPGANECGEHILGIAHTAKRFSCVREIQLEPYHRLGIGKARNLGIEDYFDAVPPDREKMEEYCRQISRLCKKKCIVS